ncbi:hypothetical protein ASE92_17350 [Pedobacter sp. Leaf41]|uniref:AAA family ATPase n=1 Tax=Pedobacter sp. Leaf41 TaxID=1736218 RepID=UPI00070382F2|nr:AAA family ATPase [Pedobacter sp. Leaf41]KQN32372.1 hypothetical protein ASE92_17350 [Pedobacter sp. Leaf41]
MKLKRFIATNAHGYLNFDIDFFEETTFLIGINGSGKTSALKLILGLISPSWINLNQIYFETAILVCETSSGEEITIQAVNLDQNSIEISISPFDIKPHKFSRMDISKVDFTASRLENRSILSYILRQEQRFHQNAVVKKIEEFTTPIFLGLDRRIYEGREIDLLNLDNLTRQKQPTEPLKGNLFESLKDIEKLVFDNYFLYTQEQSAINETLKNQIIQSSFEVLNENQLEIKIDTNPDGWKERRYQVLKAAKKINVPGIIEQLNEFFSTLEGLQAILERKNKSNKKSHSFDRQEVSAFQKWYINMPQLQRIDKIISLYDESEEKIQTEFTPFKNFENLTNTFLKESNKRLQIGNNGELIIHLPQNPEPTNIFKLSSGEQQILVMLAQLIFSENKKTEGSIFIIDEPELSLHLEWQEIFVKSIKEASPNTQFILATHSPTIIGALENQDFCQDLSQFNIF